MILEINEKLMKQFLNINGEKKCEKIFKDNAGYFLRITTTK